MLIIRHRVNRAAVLRSLSPGLGAEIDIRSSGSRLILQHAPFKGGEDLDRFLKAWRGGTLVLNPKEDGLEGELLRRMKRFRIRDFFLLDLTLPTLVRLADDGVRELAVRVSEFEPVEAALRFQSRARWAWVDCFSGKAPARRTLLRLRRRFKVCLVSPELQGYPKGRIRGFLPLARLVDAVCTDHPEIWR